MSSKLLNISTLFDYDRINYQIDSEICMDVILSAPELEDKKRFPLHLCVCLDCSGSMQGNKIESVKKTVSTLINHLLEDDGLVILGFSDNVWEVFSSDSMTKSSKEIAQKAIKELLPLASTNLSQAITMALEKVMTGKKDVVSRAIILTDGLPTTGECNSENLVKMVSNINPQISLSAFGFGSDYNPELLASLSSAGRGNFFYIQKNEDCNKAFAMELGGLLSLFGQNIKMTITPSGNFQFKELLSEYKCEQIQGYRLLTGNKVEIQIDDIFAGEKKHVVLKLAVPKATEAVCVRDTRVCSIEVSYTEVGTKKQETINLNSSIQYVKPDKAPKDPNEEIRKQLLLLEAAKIQKEAQDKADQGQYAEARQILSNGIKFVTDNAAFMPNAQPVVAMFENLSANYSDAYSYRTIGSKMATSYRCSMTSGRSSSVDTIGMNCMYMSSVQASALKSFTSSTSDPGLITLSSDPKNPVEDKDEEKKI